MSTSISKTINIKVSHELYDDSPPLWSLQIHTFFLDTNQIDGLPEIQNFQYEINWLASVG